MLKNEGSDGRVGLVVVVVGGQALLISHLQTSTLIIPLSFTQCCDLFSPLTSEREHSSNLMRDNRHTHTHTKKNAVAVIGGQHKHRHPVSLEYKISERETESTSNIDALYNNICCVPFMKYSEIHAEREGDTRRFVMVWVLHILQYMC